MLRKAIQILALTSLTALFSFSQEQAKPLGNQDSQIRNTNQDSLIPIKVDEFGPLADCDLGARVENFFFQLRKNPSATGVIILYKGTKVLPADYDSNLLEKRIRNHIGFLRLDASRVTMVRGGFREEVATEFFIVPNGSPYPQPTDTIPPPVLPKDKTFLFDNQDLRYLGDNYFFDFLDELILPSVKAKMEEENRLAEEEARIVEQDSTETSFDQTNEEYELPQPTPEEKEEVRFSWANEKFGRTIKNQKGASGVIIFYADDLNYDIGKFQNLFEEGRQKIAEAAEIPLKDIQIVYGGFRENVQAEFWIVPKNGKSPTPKPEERPVEETEN